MGKSVDVALGQDLPDLVMAKVLPTRPLVLVTISRPLSVTKGLVPAAKGLVPATRGLVMTARRRVLATGADNETTGPNNGVGL